MVCAVALVAGVGAAVLAVMEVQAMLLLLLGAMLVPALLAQVMELLLVAAMGVVAVAQMIFTRFHTHPELAVPQLIRELTRRRGATP
jgi:hypothetical protein